MRRLLVANRILTRLSLTMHLPIENHHHCNVPLRLHWRPPLPLHLTFPISRSLPPFVPPPILSQPRLSLYVRAVAFSRRRPIPQAHSGRLKLGPHNGGWPRDGINKQTLIPFRANVYGCLACRDVNWWWCWWCWRWQWRQR